MTSPSVDRFSSTTNDSCSFSSLNSQTEDENIDDFSVDDEKYALYRKKLKRILFIYQSLLDGWVVEHKGDEVFEFTRPKSQT